MSGEKLTGRRRFRSGFEGRLFPSPVMVLQVEATVLKDEDCGAYVDVRPVTIWRDARATDLTNQEAAS